MSSAEIEKNNCHAHSWANQISLLRSKIAWFSRDTGWFYYKERNAQEQNADGSLNAQTMLRRLTYYRITTLPV